LDDAEAPLFTPFAGFCAFSAATMNIYAACFPQMNLGRSPQSQADYESDLAYLDKFRTMWPMGVGWWVTIHRTKDLYQRASRDRSMFEGKTRDDFVALESSIHDCTGISPGGNEGLSAAIQSQLLEIQIEQEHTQDQETALGFPTPATPTIPREQQLSESQAIPEWNEVWSLWGEHQLASLPTEANFYDDSFHDVFNFH
jgi:hypothetical protein